MKPGKPKWKSMSLGIFSEHSKPILKLRKIYITTFFCQLTMFFFFFKQPRLVNYLFINCVFNLTNSQHIVILNSQY